MRSKPTSSAVWPSSFQELRRFASRFEISGSNRPDLRTAKRLEVAGVPIEETVIEFGTPREILFLAKHRLEFADVVLVESEDGLLRAEASVVAAQYYPERTVIAARFLERRSQLDCEIMTECQLASHNSAEDRASLLQALQPIYAALVREFVLDVAECPLEPESASKAAVKPKLARPGGLEDSGAPVAAVSPDHAAGERSGSAEPDLPSSAKAGEVVCRPRQDRFPDRSVFLVVRARAAGKRPMSASNLSRRFWSRCWARSQSSFLPGWDRLKLIQTATRAGV